MKGPGRRKVLAVGCVAGLALLVLLVAGGTRASARPSSLSHPATHSASHSESQGDGGTAALQSPSVHACEAAGKPNCNPNPGAIQTLTAGNPLAQPPSAHLHYLTEAQAIALARGQNSTAPVAARLMTLHEFEDTIYAGTKGVAVLNHDRMKWIVTVHADVMTDGSPGFAPPLKHVYSVVIDAETGIGDGGCIGCAWVK